jgi:DNA invertase Pin-like site-specific DNA recombinase
MSASQPRLRCAVYTRKSSDEGLDQEFNSLDAQREACVAYIASQVGLGWKLVPDRYDDGGISGGTMQRPALQRLLQDIQDRKIDVVVVYKIDRLTRSLGDFSKMVEIFDASSVSFVSITQQFNTTTSMGRLTLNVLLSFAQFEREVTAERIRDKIAASKRKGMWMGGVVPLGYRVENRKLVIDPAEADTVRHLFDRYLELRSVRALSGEAIRSGLQGRNRSDGRAAISTFGRGNLYHLLSNPLYVGKIRHGQAIYDGEHEAIIDRDVFDRAQQLLAEQAPKRRAASNSKGVHLLQGLVFDEAGASLRSVFATKAGKRHRYYVSKQFTEEQRKGRDGWRLPAHELESIVEAALIQRLCNAAQLAEDIQELIEPSAIARSIARAIKVADAWPEHMAEQRRATIATLIHHIDLKRGELNIQIDRLALCELVTGSPVDRTEDLADTIITISHPMSLRRRGVETKMVLTNGPATTRPPDRKLIELLARAHSFLDCLTRGRMNSLTDVATAHRTNLSEVSRLLPLAFLSSQIVTAILNGTQPIEVTARKLSRVTELPISWREQQALLQI